MSRLHIHLDSAPTRKADYPQEGDQVESIFGKGMRGTVKRVVETSSLPYAVVKWENGSLGRHTLTTIKKVHDGDMVLEREKADLATAKRELARIESGEVQASPGRVKAIKRVIEEKTRRIADLESRSRG